MTKSRRPVKRSYSSPLRVEQARATRSAILDAAATLFAQHGYVAVSLDAVAEAAGVSRATVFTSVGGKAALLAAAYGSAFGRAAGEATNDMPLVERPRSRAVRAETSAKGYLAAYAALATDIAHHLASLHDAVREAARTDAEARALLDRVQSVRRNGASTIVADVGARATLRSGLDEQHAADVVWALIDPSLFRMLVHERGWPEERFRDWLAETLALQLIGKRA